MHRTSTDNLPLLALLVMLLAAVALPSLGSEPQISSDPDNPLTPREDSYEYSSEDGNFRVTWPSGCSRIRVRMPREDEDEEAPDRVEYPVIVSCDRNGEKGEGCSVTVLFNARRPDGSPADPAEVAARMEKMLRNLGAEIQRQAPLSKDFGNGLVVRGLDVLAAQTGGAGKVWLRGLMVEGDVYIMAAWNLKGGIWDDPEYITFFNSFQPGAQ